MPAFVTHPSLRELRTALLAADVAGGDEAGFRAALAGSKGEAPTPWFIRVLMGFGAWVSAVFLALAVALCGIWASASSMAVCGLAAFVGATVLRWRVRNDFGVQLALAASIGGRGLVYAAALKDGNETSVLTVALGLEAIAMLVYPDVVGRFVATLGVCFAAVLLPRELHWAAASSDAVIILIAVAASALWWLEPELFATRFRALHPPIAFGFVTSLLLALCVICWNDFERGSALRSPLQGVALTLLLLAVELRVMTRFRSARSARSVPPLAPVLVYGGTLGLGAMALRVPGLSAAVLVMALGAWRRRPLLFGLASLSLLCFGSNFYYDLEMTLLAKSGVLVGSGLLLLALRVPLTRLTGRTGPALS